MEENIDIISNQAIFACGFRDFLHPRGIKMEGRGIWHDLQFLVLFKRFRPCWLDVIKSNYSPLNYTTFTRRKGPWTPQVPQPMTDRLTHPSPLLDNQFKYKNWRMRLKIMVHNSLNNHNLPGGEPRTPFWPSESGGSSYSTQENGFSNNAQTCQRDTILSNRGFEEDIG